MLKKKPHYAKYFTELEEELDDKEAFFKTHFKDGNFTQLNPEQAKVLSHNRLSNIFNADELPQGMYNSQSTDMAIHDQPQVEELVSQAPRLDRRDYMKIYYPYQDVNALGFAVEALEEANYCMQKPEEII